MRSAWLSSPALLVVLALSGCKHEATCEAHCGPCDGAEPIPYDTLSPVRYGSDSQGTPVVELLFEPEGSCPGESTKSWMAWKDGAPALGEPAGDLDTDTAELVYLTDLHSRAILWHNADLLLPFDGTWGAFTFTVIEGGEDAGAFRCASAGAALECEPVPH